MIYIFLNSRFFLIFLTPFFLGCATVLSFQPFNYSFINFLIFPLFFFLITYAQKKSRNTYRKKPYLLNLFLIGYLFGIGFFLAGTFWISYSLTFDANFNFLIPFALIGLPLFLGIFFGISSLVAGPFLMNNFTSILLFSSTLSFMDFLRERVLTGFPWNSWAYSWSWKPELLQTLPLIGFHSLNLIVIVIYCSPLLLFFENKKKNLSILFLISVLFFINFIFGSTIISNNTEKNQDIKSNVYNTIYIKIISPKFDLEYNLSGEDIEKNIEELIKYSEPSFNKKTLFIWPEGVFSGYSFEEIKKYKSIFKKNFSDKHFILFGSNTTSITANQVEETYNSMLVVNNEFEILHKYNKIKLVPFGEFLPLESFLSKIGLKKITEGHGSFKKGSKQKIFELNNVNILPLICYEIIFPGVINDNENKKNLIVNISEDAWFGDSIGPHQHFAKAIFRAIENNVYLARSANKGLSAFIDNKGVTIKSLKPNEAGVIELNVPIINNKKLGYKIDLIFFVLLFTHVLIFIILRKKTL